MHFSVTIKKYLHGTLLNPSIQNKLIQKLFCETNRDIPVSLEIKKIQLSDHGAFFIVLVTGIKKMSTEFSCQGKVGTMNLVGSKFGRKIILLVLKIYRRTCY